MHVGYNADKRKTEVMPVIDSGCTSLKKKFQAKAINMNLNKARPNEITYHGMEKTQCKVNDMIC